MKRQNGNTRQNSRMKRVHIVFVRLAYCLLFISIQAAVLIFMYLFAVEQLPYFLLGCTVLSLLCAAHLINRNDNPAYTVAWLVPMLLLPIFGGLLYLMFGSGRVTKKQRALSFLLRKNAETDVGVPDAVGKLNGNEPEKTAGNAAVETAAKTDRNTAGKTAETPKTAKAVETQAQKTTETPKTAETSKTAETTEPKEAPEGAASARMQSAYLSRVSGCLPYEDTETLYFPSGEAMLPEMLSVLRRAESYIFISAFIIGEGVFWDAVLAVLREKAEAGLDVRVMYDDFGCLLTLPRRYDGYLRSLGIRSQVYNRFNTILSPRPNNRDHRKLCIVDGKYGFCGGINFADEYINRRVRFGYWKDAAVLLRGPGVWGMTAQYLSVWDFCAGEREALSPFVPKTWEKPEKSNITADSGIVQPFTDIPMDREQVGETVYFHLITKAERYVWIMSPYLVIDHTLLTALTAAAKSGADVRILTPFVPDKRVIHFLTRSYYRPLLEAGVRIFEYTPGFLHAKTVVSDDRFAVVGSINLDYRSLYLHTECGIWMYGTDAVRAVRDDFLHTQEESAEVTTGQLGRLTWYKRLWLSVLRTFAPLF